MIDETEFKHGLNKLDGVAAVNFQEPSPGDLERVCLENVRLVNENKQLVAERDALKTEINLANELIMFDSNEASDGACMNHAAKLDRYRKNWSKNNETNSILLR